MGLLNTAKSIAIARVFPSRTKSSPTDDLAFFDEPPLFTPKVDEVHISVTFTWDMEKAERWAKAWNRIAPTKIGGPAYGMIGDEFIPGMYLKEGITITSRGCLKNCPWCVVSKREGKLRELEIKDGWIVQDNNLLACSKEHLLAVFEMLKRQGKAASFPGGLDKHFLKPWHRELFDSITVGELWFACDRESDVSQMEKVAEIFKGYPIRKMRCYALIGFDGEEIGAARHRLETLCDMGFLPFAQLFQSETGERKIWSKEWSDLSRTYSRPAITMSEIKKRHTAKSLGKASPFQTEKNIS